MLSSLLPSFVQRHRLAASLVGVVVACGIIIPACGANSSDAPAQPGAGNQATVLGFAPTNPTEVYGGQTVRVAATLVSGTATVTPASLTYSISSADQAYATIAANGDVTAAAVQTGSHAVTVTATATAPTGYDNPGTATTSITVRSRVTALALSAGPATFHVGDQVNLIATPTFAAGSPSTPAPVVTWVSSNPAAVAVNATGKISAIAVTTAPVTITATSEGTASNAASISVSAAIVPAVAITPKTVTLAFNQTQQYAAAIVNPIAGGTTTFIRRAAAASIYDVTAGGLVTAKAATATATPAYVIASYTAGSVTVLDSAAIVVVAPTIAITPKTATVQVGAKVQVMGITTNGGLNGTAVGYASRDLSKAVVDVNGVVTGQAVTTAPVYIVTSYANNGVTVFDSAAITVTAAAVAPTIVFSPNPVTVDVANTAQISANVQNPTSNGTLVLAFRSSVNASYSPSFGGNTNAGGSITGNAAGSVYLIATYTSGTSIVVDSVKVTITIAGGTTSRVNRITIDPSDATVSASSTFTYTIRFYDVNGAPTTPELTDGGAVRFFFNAPASVATLTQSTTDPTTATVTTVGPGTTSLTVIYTRNGYVVASANTSLTIVGPH
jgi:hypothetical protein